VNNLHTIYFVGLLSVFNIIFSHFLYAENGTLYKHKKNGKIGYIDIQGNWVIEPKYQSAKKFRGNNTTAKINGKYGLIDRKGNWVIEPKFQRLESFKDGFAFAQHNGLHGTIDIEGHWIIKPKYVEIMPYKDGMIGVRVRIGYKWGFIDAKGEMVIEPQFSKISSFRHGIAYTKLNIEECNEFGVAADPSHNYYPPKKIKVIKVKSKKIIFKSRKIVPKQPNCAAYIDKKGQRLVRSQYLSMNQYGRRPFPVTIWEKDSLKIKKQGYMNIKGEFVFELSPEFSEMDSFLEGFAMVKMANKKWGYINKKGEIAVQPVYDKTTGFQDGFARVKLGGLWGIINRKGKWIIEPIFEDIFRFYDGNAKAKLGGLWGYVNQKGKWIIEPTFESMVRFYDGIANAKLGGLWGFVNQKGEWLVEPKYDRVSKFRNGMACVYTNCKDKISTFKCTIGYVNTKGEIVISPQFKYAFNFTNGIAKVQYENDTDWRLINTKGEFIVPK